MIKWVQENVSKGNIFWKVFLVNASLTLRSLPTESVGLFCFCIIKNSCTIFVQLWPRQELPAVFCTRWVHLGNPTVFYQSFYLIVKYNPFGTLSSAKIWECFFVCYALSSTLSCKMINFSFRSFTLAKLLFISLM